MASLRRQWRRCPPTWELRRDDIRGYRGEVAWYGLFSHRRDRVWKGMLSVELADLSDETAVRLVLESRQ
ncbi:MAG: hypothetical protein ACYC3I_13530 [Gemmataceae bacterium]